MESRNVAPGFEQQQTTRPPSQQKQHGESNIRPDLTQHDKPERQISDHPEGKVARPHRCNDRLEDLIQALFEGHPRKNLPGPARLFYRCIQSNPGQEPSEPFFFLKIDPPGTVNSEAASK